MRPVQDSRISHDGEKYYSKCLGCKREISSKYKVCLRRTLANGYCRKCATRYNKANVPQNESGKWISHCPKCGVEQTYTRPESARASEREGWVCRNCRDSSNTGPVGNERRLYNKYKKSAANRGIDWNINLEQFIGEYNGVCTMTGWELSMDYKKSTASLDRIDSSKGYEVGNLQWVHSMVNMAKSRYPHEKFVEMCVAIAKKVKDDG